jgi:hypothetical protein
MSQKPKAYIAGPMRGVDLYNFPAFDETAERYRQYGYEVFNPADLDRQKGFDPEELPVDFDFSQAPEGFQLNETIRDDVTELLSCNVIVMLPGWEDSKGARAEHALARWAELNVVYENAY